MALSGFPPPLPPQMAQTFFTSSPALIPLATASLPQTAKKEIFSPLTEASTATTSGALSRRKSPIWRRPFASRPLRTAVRTFNPPTSLAAVRNCLASPKDASALNFSRACRSSLFSAACWLILLSSSPGVVFSSWAAWNSIC